VTTRLIVLVCALAATSCGKSDNPVAPTLTETPLSTELFTGTIGPRESRFYSFEVFSGGTVTVMLASISGGPLGPTYNGTMQLGMGIPEAEDCSVAAPLVTRPALTPQISQSAKGGFYCVRLADIGGLPSAMNFAIRIVHP
jgi:hypothetical protein